MKNFEISNFIKERILEDSNNILNFIRNFKGGEGDEEDFAKLCECIDNNRIAIPVPVQEKIDSFVKEHLEPMVYEAETVFPIVYEGGYIGKDGIRHIDTEEEMIQMMSEYFEVIIEIKDKWSEFSMKELHPYLIG